MPLNTYISFYSQSLNSEEGKDEYSLMNTLPSEKEKNPEEMMIEQENVEQIESAILKELSEFEKQVFELHLTGMTYTEIAKVLGRDEKSTDNALQRMKTKIKKLLKENSIK